MLYLRAPQGPDFFAQERESNVLFGDELLRFGAVQKHADTVIERCGEPSRIMIPKEFYRVDLQWFTSTLWQAQHPLLDGPVFCERSQTKKNPNSH
jgi:hypothetical protein